MEVSGLKSFFNLSPKGRAWCVEEPKEPPKPRGGGGGAPKAEDTPGRGGGGGHPGKGGGGGGGGGGGIPGAEVVSGGPDCDVCPTCAGDKPTGTAPN